MNRTVAASLIKENKKPFLFGNIPIQFIHPSDHPINFDQVVSRIQSLVNRKFFSSIEGIYVGDFDVLKKRSISAMYADNAIYVSNALRDEDVVVTDIVHELAHCLESDHGYDIYADGEINEEFVAKRMALLAVLKKNDFDISIAARSFLYTEFDQVFDDFLYKEIGYDKLSLISSNIFLSSYSITSLSEYFAIGFENFCLFPENRHIIKEMCPKLYRKLGRFMKKGKR